MIEFKKVSVFSEDAGILMGELNERLTAVVGNDGTAYLTLADFDRAGAAFIVGYEAGAPMCCAGIRRMDDARCEIKRVYARQNQNGNAVQLMHHMETLAKQLGYREAYLTCRQKNVHAIAFYKRNGYCAGEKYPPYLNVPQAVCMKKLLLTEADTLCPQQGRMEDVDEIMSLIRSAVDTMEAQGIHQWDALYPTREDFEQDIQAGNLFTLRAAGRLIALYVISTECDEQYDRAAWQYEKEGACVIHRLCVSPQVQHMGIGKKVLEEIERRLREGGYTSARLDVFTQNPYAMRLYERDGFAVRGYADWRMGRFALMEKYLGE